MAPLQRKLRRALGTVKDQTSIGIAKVAGSGAPDLEVALVKATSHDEMPVEEKYVQEILHLTSLSRGYVSACVASISKRLSKTHNWVVAIKALLLTHRLLRDGDSFFEQELLSGSRRGLRVLNLSNFRDDSHSNAWDYSAFVRTYALFLDEKLDYNIAIARDDIGGSTAIVVRRSTSYDDDNRFDRRGRGGNGSYGSHRDLSYRDRSYGGHSDYDDDGRDRWRDDDRSGDRWRGDRHGGGRQKEEISDKKSGFLHAKDMTPQELLHRIPIMQRLMERILACRPTGSARMNGLVQIALYPVVRESFYLYTEICDGLAIVLDAFFDMEHADCVKAFEIYTKGAKQIDELASFYGACKNLGVCRSSEYPVVQRVSEELIETMEDFLRNRSAESRQRKKSPELTRPKSPSPEPEAEPDDINGMKALPAPPVPDVETSKIETSPVQQQEQEPDLLGLNSNPVSAEEHGDRLALALFSETAPSNNNNNKSAMSDRGQLSGWELALVESTSELSSKPTSKPLAGGFDNLLLTSMYDQAASNQKAASYTLSSGSASSVALTARPPSTFLALPAPPSATAQAGEDPFAASLLVPPPPYVQMADMTVKQQLLVQEQQTWYQYQQDGMQGLMKFHNPGYSTFQAYQPVPYYGASYY